MCSAFCILYYETFVNQICVLPEYMLVKMKCSKTKYLIALAVSLDGDFI